MHSSYRISLFSKISLFILALAVILVMGSVVWAGTTPPVTSHTFGGTLGNDAWYRSNIDVNLTSTDTESGINNITYWVDTDSPTVVNFTSSPVDPFLNNSMESGWFLGVNNWYAGLSGLALYYRSSVAAYQASRSAAIAFIDFGGNDYYHWHNAPNSVEYTPGEDAQISAWARTVVFPGDVSYMEVWGENVSGGGDHLLATSNILDGFSWSWREATASFTVPTDGTHYIYVKLGAKGSPAAIIYWDYVIGTSVLRTAETDFTFTEEGVHTLHYFGEDNASNIEVEKTASLKKDTVIPNPWQNFADASGGCAVCYVTSAENRDLTSGIDVSSAEYRYYTEFGGQFWSSWVAVAGVTTVASGSPAADGEVGFVRLEAPEIDFGDDSGRPFKVQFRINDQAGNANSSPVYEIVSPWIQGLDGSIYIAGEISIPASSDGTEHANGDVMTEDDIVSFNTSATWTDDDYQHAFFGATTIGDILPEYVRIKADAVALPGGDLPVSNGIYILNSGYTIQASTIPSGYDTASVSAVVIIEGDLVIADGYQVASGNNTVYLVEGDVLVGSTVEDIAGFFIAEGQFDSDTAGTADLPLVVSGSVVALAGFSLPRDLGDTNPVNNTNSPAEIFNWQPDTLTDEVLSGFLNQMEMEYRWQEVVQP